MSNEQDRKAAYRFVAEVLDPVRIRAHMEPSVAFEIIAIQQAMKRAGYVPNLDTVNGDGELPEHLKP